MALLAETLVEEWLNRRGYFTIRGVREGVSEMDLLAFKPLDGTAVEALHVEVQTSFRPISYICPLTKNLAASTGKARGFTVHRTPEMLKECVSEWVQKKYLSPKKVNRRKALWPGSEWKLMLVHAAIKYPEELQEIGKRGVVLIPLERVLEDLGYAIRTFVLCTTICSVVCNCSRVKGKRRMVGVRRWFWPQPWR